MNPVNAPDRQPDLSKDNGLKIWFEEMLCCTKITTRDDFHLCYMVITLDKRVAVVVPEDWTPKGLMLFMEVERGDVMPFSDEINEAYWKWVGEKILLE